MSIAFNLSCSCGKTQLGIEGKPIASVECCCESCRTAAARLRVLPGFPATLGEHGTTRFEMYRKDRVRVLGGASNMREFRLAGGSTTRRVLAGCCNTPLFLDFHNGHWFSVYGTLWRDRALPPLQMRTMTSDLQRPALPSDVPNAKHHSVAFFARLLAAWLAMRFRVPRIDVQGTIDV